MSTSQSGDTDLLHEALDQVYSLSYRTGDLSAYLDRVVATVARLLRQDWVAVTLLVERGQEKVLASSLASFDKGRLYEYHGSVSDTVLRTGHPLTISNAGRDTRHGSVPDGYCAYLGVPLFNMAGEPVGTICSFHKTERHYTDEQVRIASVFAERASIAIDNYQLYLEQKRFKERLEDQVVQRTRELEATQARLIASERLAAIGEVVSAIVHEVRSPLSTIGMALEYLERRERDAGALRRLGLARREGRRLENLLEEILVYARPHHLEFTRVSVPNLIRDVVEGLDTEAAGGSGDWLSLDSETEVEIMADADKLRQVLINLLRNAAEACPGGDPVRVSWTVSAEDRVRISVRNGGAPIPREMLSRLTEPFYSTKPHGTGLGLAIVKRIVEQHQGELHIASGDEHGTEVRVVLPVRQP